MTQACMVNSIAVRCISMPWKDSLTSFWRYCEEMENNPQKVGWCGSHVPFLDLEIRDAAIARSFFCSSTNSVKSLIRPWILYCLVSLPSAESPCTFTPLASRKLRQASTFSICREDGRQSAQRRDTARMWQYSTFNEPKCLGAEGSEDGDVQRYYP